MTDLQIGWKPTILTLTLAIFASCAAFVGTAQPHTPDGDPARTSGPVAQGPEYADGEACFACHDIESAFKRNPHYKNWTATDKDWSQKGCQTCHGPGQAHIDAGGDKARIFSFNEVTAQEISDRCLDCHLSQSEEHSNFLRNEHGVNTVACTSCHTVHTPQTERALLKAEMPALCYDCHGEVRAQFRKPFRHKVNEGLMKCVDCHNQHGGFNVRQLRETTGNDAACYQCHSDKQGPFVYEHAPVKVEGCTLCHEAHSSSNPRMLKRSEVRFLCLECHSETLGVFSPGTPSFHRITTSAYQNCTTCHVNIHGSNLHPAFFE